MTDKTERAAFEAWISGPPYQYPTDRFGPDSAWPGNYCLINVDLAWCAWNARAAVPVSPSLPEGWQMVPIDPTMEMLEAVDAVQPAGSMEVWDAMLAAAPVIPKDPSA